ncbi:MAG TPA: autotransporter-associated beta strand repeat-containing protein [Microvirga sp.]|jgi:T5SS/PEP-CTERM-associated repeat protein/autotransporter-associated beta strand protein|nr:autotransporter-associated beta strand repeat-containing protein [Microvirga sp.]
MASGVTFDNGASIGIVGNSYGGLVKIRNATVDLGGVTTIGNTLYVGEGVDGNGSTNLGTLTVNSPGTVLTVGNHAYIGANGGTGILHLKNGATLDVRASTLPSTESGPVTIADVVGSTGTLNIGGTPDGTAIAAGTLNAATVTFGAGTGFINFNHTNTTAGLTFAPSIVGDGNINAIAGITRLTGDSSGFTGDLFVKGGAAVAGDGATLEINGVSPFGTDVSTITVEADGKLVVAANIGGSVTVASGGTLVGNQGATHSIGSLALNETSQLSLGLGTPSTMPLFSISGAFTLDGQLSIANLGGFEEGTYTLFNYNGSFTNAGLTITSFPPGFNVGDWTITSDSDEVFLQIAVGSGKQYWDGGDQASDAAVDGGSGTWSSNATNWTNADGNINASWAGERAVFAGTAGTVTVVGAQTFTGLIFDVDGYSLIGGPTDSLGIAAGKDATITVNGASAAIGTPITGSTGLVKLGTGALTLSEINTYAGLTTVQAGTLLLAGDGSVSSSSGVDIASGANFSLSGISGASATIGNLSGAGGVNVGSKTLIATISASSTYSGSISGTGGFEKQGSGTLSFGSAASTANLAEIEIASGTLALAGGDNVGNSTRVDISGASGTLTIATNEAIGALDGVAGSTVVQTSGALTLGGSVASATFAGVISGAGTLVKSGTGTQILTGDNTYATGIASGAVATTVAGGTLRITDGGSITHTAGVTVVGTTSVAASLQIVDGSVSNREGRIATTTGANGSVTVGADGTWTNARAISVGTSGTGSLTIENGGDVTSQTGMIGGGAGSSGTVVVSGVGSTWTTELGIDVGGTNGTGDTLTIRDGGTVTNTDDLVTYSVKIGANSAVNIGAAGSSAAAGAGTLDVAAIQLKSSTSVLNFNHTSDNYIFDSRIDFASTGSLNVRAGQTTLTGEITGASTPSQAGKINIYSDATLVLDGYGQDFTGATLLHGGTLELANSSALGQSLITLPFFEFDPFNVKVQNGGVIDFAPGVTIAAGVQFNSAGSMNVDAGTATLSGVVGGSFGLTKTGTGTLVLSGNNSQHSGGMTIEAGTLALQASVSAGAGSITFASSAASTLRVQNFSLDNNLLGFGFDDHIDLQRLTFDSGGVVTSLYGGVLTVSQGTTSLTFKFGDLAGDAQFRTMEDTDGSTLLAVVATPVLTAGGSTPAHTEDAGATVVDSGLVVADRDSTTLAGATVTITDFVAGDVLSFANQSGITGSYNGANGVLTLTGSASVADYQTALRSVTYSSDSDNPATEAGNGDRVITFAVSDGTLTSTSPGVTLLVANANDAPVLDASQSPALTGISEDALAPTNGSTAGSTLVSVLLGGVSDPDLSDLKGLAVTGVSDKGSLYYSLDNGGTWTLLSSAVSGTSALVLHDTARLFFKPNLDVNGPITDAITFKAWDRTDVATNGQTGVNTTIGSAFSSTSDTAALTITTVNDAPVITLPGAPLVSENALNVAVSDDIHITDVDGDAQTVTLTATGGTVSVGATGLTFTTGDGTSDATMTFSGSLVQVNAALDSLTFTPASNTSGTNVASIQISTDDGASSNSTDSETLTFSVLGAPEVLSIVRAGGAGADTNADAVSYTVTFSEAVTGVDATDFQLTAPVAVTGEVITGVSGSGDTYTVTVATGTGDGALRLDLADDNSIKNSAGVALVGSATLDGSFAVGESYSIDKTGPATTISAIDLSADTGSATDFSTSTSAQTVTATLSAALAAGETLQGSVNGGASWTPIPAGMISGTAVSWTGVTLQAGAGQEIRFRVLDALGNAGAEAKQAYTLDTTAPMAPVLTPLDDATGVAVGANLVLTFGETIAKGTGDITIHRSSDNSVVETISVGSATVSVTSNVLTINPAANLSYATGYYVTVEPGAVLDVAGNPYAGIADATTFNFTTQAAPPPPPPPPPPGGPTLGDDTLVGTSGSDTIDALGGNDSVKGGTGDDLLSGNEGADTLGGGDGNDSVFGGEGNDLVMGGNGNDLIFGSEGNDTALGGTGEDTIYAGNGSDLVFAGEGDDEAGGGAGSDTLYGGGGADTLYGGANNDTLLGGNDNDVLAGGTGDDVLMGGAGDDQVAAGEGNDTVYAGEGKDEVFGGVGNDLAYGGVGADTLYGGGGADTLSGGADNDVMYGGADADVFAFYRGNTGDDVINGFSFADGDRLDLDGQSYTLAAQQGGVLVSLEDGGTILLAGLTPDQVQSSWFV